MSTGKNTAAHDLVKSWRWLDPFANLFGAIVGGFYEVPGTRSLRTAARSSARGMRRASA